MQGFGRKYKDNKKRKAFIQSNHVSNNLTLKDPKAPLLFKDGPEAEVPPGHWWKAKKLSRAVQFS
jgi:hypothetical protein